MPTLTHKTLRILLLTTLTNSVAWAEILQPQPMPMAQPMVTAPAPVPPPPVMPQVSRATFTSAIAGREPTDQLTRIPAGRQVFYFTELTGLQGHVISHRWERDGHFQLGLQFPVTGNPWRVNSSKSLSPNQAGTWTVTVQNDDGVILRRDTLIVDPPAAVPNPIAIPPALPPAVMPLSNVTPQPMLSPLQTPVPRSSPLPTPAVTAPAMPIIPPPAQPLTNIPPELKRDPSARPTTPSESSSNPPSTTSATNTNNQADTSSGTNKRPYWESLSR